MAPPSRTDESSNDARTSLALDGNGVVVVVPIVARRVDDRDLKVRSNIDRSAIEDDVVVHVESIMRLTARGARLDSSRALECSSCLMISRRSSKGGC